MAVGKRLLIVLIVAAVSIFVVAFVIGYFTGPSNKNENTKSITGKSSSKEKNRLMQHTKLYESLDANKLREYLRDFTDQPHLAGSKIQLEYGENIKTEWSSYKETFNKVESFPYRVYLSYMKKGDSNKVQILNETSQGVLAEFTGLEKDSKVQVAPMLGYAKPGEATGRLMYMNYGRQQDFDLLKTQYGANCSGSVVIMRYGNGYRGNKVDLAAKCGAVAAILYNDPEDTAPLGENNTYPDTWWLPPSGVQRGNIRLVKGDPLTPGVPALDKIYRMKPEDVYMPAIPATPLPYAQAKELLKLIKGAEAPAEWQGGLNFKYNLGLNDNGPLVKVVVNAKLEQRAVTNIIGSIRGEEEPDRWVLIGAHRDAWSAGAVDSSCGTAILMELARGLNELVKSGWRPRRTIKLCSWAAEEQGLIGSNEWVEQLSVTLSDRAVAYINIDAVVRGNYSLKANGSPLLKQLIYEESKKVEDPNDESKEKNLNLFERWSETSGSQYPKYGTLGSGSDYASFYQILGIPCLTFEYAFNDLNVTFYPVYHSRYDTFAWMEKFVDPHFLIHLAMSKLSARVLLRLADSPSLPMVTKDYSASLIASMKKFNKEALKQSPETISFDNIEEAITQLNKTTKAFDEMVKDVGLDDATQLRVTNNQMSKLEQIFINPNGLPGRPYFRNIIFSPSATNSYGSSSFPGVSDLLATSPSTDWTEVKKQLNILYKSLVEANQFLQPVG